MRKRRRRRTRTSGWLRDNRVPGMNDPYTEKQMIGFSIRLIRNMKLEKDLRLLADSLMDRDACRTLENEILKLAKPILSKCEDLKVSVEALKLGRTRAHLWAAAARIKGAIGDAALKRIILQLLRKRSKALGRSLGTSGKRLKELSSVVGLDKNETRLVSWLNCIYQSSQLGALLAGASLSKMADTTAIAIDSTPAEVKKCLSPGSKLRSSGILSTFDPDFTPPAQLNDDILSFLAGIGDGPLSSRYCMIRSEKPFSIESFDIPDRSLQIMQALVGSDGPAHILLHGVPGTGKTEFTRALAASVNKTAYFLHQAYEEGPGRFAQSRWKMILNTTTSSIPPSAGVIVVDEADTILNTRFFNKGGQTSIDKSWLNTFLDNCPAQVIWITNERGSMVESTLRRFSYSMGFKRFNSTDRERVWNNLVETHPLKQHFDKRLIREMSATYKVNTGGIASALDTLPRILAAETADRDSVRAIMGELLEKHQELTRGERPAAMNAISTNYDRDAVNLDTEAGSILSSIQSYNEAAEAGPAAGSLGLLFWGPPGTGKTEFAKHLAEETGMGLLVRRASDLMSCWVGETEKNINKTFRDAEREKAILLLDEADSMFTDRTTAVRAYESSRTNELLTQMENFNGILICCTNLLDHLDHAVLRRFAWKVKFDSLSTEGKVRLYTKYFCDPDSQLPTDVAARLGRIDGLTPGDIKAVWQRHRFLPDNVAGHESRLEALEHEVTYRSKDAQTIGFGASE